MKTPVVVTDCHRGICFGYLEEVDKVNNTAILSGARHVYYYVCHPDAKGIFGLAIKGPQSGSRIGPSIGKIQVLDVSKIIHVEESAMPQWEAQGWD